MARPTGDTTWLDLGTTKLEATLTFYSELFGWTFEDTGEEFGHYHMISNDGAPVGGLMDVAGMPMPDGTPLESGWDVYLAVDDVDARLARATEHGASVFSPAMDIGPLGRSAMITDPTAARVGLWQANEFEGFEFTGAPGSPVWFELMTHEFDAAREFYSTLLDIQLEPMGESMDDGMMRYLNAGPMDSATWGLGDSTAFMPKEATGWRAYLAVESADPAAAKVQELGGSVLDGPIDSPFGRFATVADPDGATFQICAMSEAVGEGAAAGEPEVGATTAG
ncbi:VOC family protein [Brachybacterium sp. GCM10030252]|uniref:VOC family protein n=1 Tax=Brachybacterium sp. GCM10030252 TaxID=3273380 RepID=UPI003619841C